MKPKADLTQPEIPPLPPATGSAALLEIIKACEDYQNEDAEGMSMETQCDNGYRCSMKVITIASAALQELEARQNTERSGSATP